MGTKTVSSLTTLSPPQRAARVKGAGSPRRTDAVGPLTGGLLFIREFIDKPGVIGAVAPSTVFLARAMVKGLDLENARAVVEYGPGSGIFTGQILKEIGAGTRFLAIERSAAMAALVRRKHPGADIVEDSAANVRSICAAKGIGEVDYVLSGLPWMTFPPELRAQILAPTAAALRPGGQFVTFGYHVGLLMRRAWVFRRELASVFSRVEVSRVVWANFPPAFIYRCTN